MADRREKVTLILDDQFTTGMARAAAATAILDKNLSSLSGDAVKSTRIELDKTAESAEKTSDGLDGVGTSARRSGAEIDRMSGRLRLITDAALTLGPALIPIGAAAVPALFALTAGFGAAAGAAGVALIAVNGIGDGLEALNDYQLEPTQANLDKLNEQMESLGPAGASFVAYLDDLEPQLRGLQQITRAGLFPGVQDGIDSLLAMLPQVRVLLFNLSTALGGVAASAGAALSGDGFAEFFNYLETQAGPLLTSFAATLGNAAQGFASLIVAFAPLTGGFVAGMERMSAAFADWAAGVSQTDGFQSFVSYIQRTGPEVVALLGAMATAFVGILQAAAPVGEALLPVLTSLAKVLGAIAASPIGPPLFTAVAALVAVNRVASLTDAAMLRLKGSTEAAGRSMASIGKGIEFGVILAAIEGIDMAFDKAFGDRDISSSTLMRDLESLANGQVSDNLDRIGQDLENINSKGLELTDTAFGWLPGETTWNEASNNIGKVDEALAQMVEGGNADGAADAMEKIAEAAREQGVSVEEIAKWFPQYNTALENSGGASDAAAAAARRLAEADYEVVTSAGATRTEINGLVAAMEEQRSAALGAFDAITQYAQALMDARKQAEKSNAGIKFSNDMTRAQRVEVIANRTALSQLSAAWNNQSAAVRNNSEKYREARSEFISTAKQMGATGEEARKLANRVLEIPRQRVIDIQLMNIDQSSADLRRIKREVESIPRRWQTDYYVNQINTINRRFAPEVGIPTQEADGGTVPKTGQPYADRHFYMLADGEEVVSNRYGQADRHRPLLKAINAGLLADGGTAGIPGLMFGGTVGNGSTFSSGYGFDPDSPLFGIDQASLSVRELAARLSDLGATQIKGLSRDFDKLSKFELTKLGKALDLATKAIEKQAEKANEFADEQREQLKALRDARRQFAQEVMSGFRSDIFGGLDLEQAARDGLLGGHFQNGLMEWLRANNIEMTAGTQLSDYAGQYLQTLSPSQLAALQAQASVGQLGLDSQNAQAFEQVLQQLSDMGLTGGAYTQLAGSGDLALAQQYLAMGPDSVARLMREFKDRNRSLQSLGASVGNERFGADIREQLQAFRRANRIAERQEAELREANRLNRQLDRRIAHLERLAERAPGETGKETANAVNSGAASTRRRP